MKNKIWAIGIIVVMVLGVGLVAASMSDKKRSPQRLIPSIRLLIDSIGIHITFIGIKNKE